PRSPRPTKPRRPRPRCAPRNAPKPSALAHATPVPTANQRRRRPSRPRPNRSPPRSAPLAQRLARDVRNPDTGQRRPDTGHERPDTGQRRPDNRKGAMTPTTGATSTTPVIAVAAIVFDEQWRTLVVERGRAPGIGLWTVPGGKVEIGESLVQAVAR